MRKLFFSLIASIFILFFVWTAIAYSRYGSDLIQHHLNIEAMMRRFTTNFTSYNVFDDLNNINHLLSFFKDYTLIGGLDKFLEGTIGFSLGSQLDEVFKDSNLFNIFYNLIALFTTPITATVFVVALAGYSLISATTILFAMLQVILHIGSFVIDPIFI